MGDAKRKKAADTFGALDDELRALGIPTGAFAFYDSEPFLAAERKDARFLEKYARWVMLRPRDAAYDAHARRVIPQVATLVAAALTKDRVEGGCVNTSGMLGRMLDRLGVWSFGVAGCTTLELEKTGERRSFPTIDTIDLPGGVTGHSWVVAPPFQVVDASISRQWWHGHPLAQHVPQTILIEEGAAIVAPELDDVVGAEHQIRAALREGRRDPQLHFRLEPRLRDFGKRFPAVQSNIDGLRGRYVPVAVRLSDVDLEEIASPNGRGRPAVEIWTEDVAPRFRELLA